MKLLKISINIIIFLALICLFINVNSNIDESSNFKNKTEQLMLTFTYEGGKLKLNSVDKVLGFDSVRSYPLTKESYSYNVTDSKGNILQKGYFDIPKFAVREFVFQSGNLGGFPVSLEKNIFPIVIPYNKNLSKIDIVNSKGIVEMVIEGVLNHSMKTSALPTNISLYKGECVSILKNAPPSEALDIVFLADKGGNVRSYSLEEFYSDLDIAINQFKTVYPYSSYIENINFYYVNKLFDLKCHGIAFPAICSFTLTKLAALNCPHDQIIVFTPTAHGGMAPWGYGYAFMSEPYLVVHEFSHSFGALGDEYEYMQPIKWPYEFPNCDKDTSGSEDIACPDWSWAETESAKIGCYPGCGWKNLNRPTEEYCLMRNINFLYFDVVCEKHLEGLLSKYY